jgi:hypothetical protein
VRRWLKHASLLLRMYPAAAAAGKTAQNSLDWSNNIIKMVTSGSKGSFINISQVWAEPVVCW